MSDALIDALSEAGEAVRDQLWPHFGPYVGALVRRWLRPDDDPGDLLDDLYVAFTELVERYDPQRGVPLGHYLGTMLHQFCRTRCRTEQRRRRRVRLVPYHLERAGSGEAVDPTREWDFAIVLQQMVVRLPEALASLTPGRRQAVTLRYLEERDYPEVAAVMGVTRATARSQVRFGLRDLRAYMAYMRGDDDGRLEL